MITSEQLKAARGLLRMSQRGLADAADVSLETIKRIEAKPGQVSANTRTMDAIKRALETAGVEFTNGDQPGVRMARNDRDG